MSRTARARSRRVASLGCALVALSPGAALAAPPPNDAFTGAAPFEGYSARFGFPIERQATAELAEATADPGTSPCLGRASMARTAWFVVPSSPNAREITFEAAGRTTDPIDLAAFVQDDPAIPPVRANACAGIGVFGDDATEDRTTALRLRVPGFRQVLLQVGRRGPAGSPDDERALITLEEIALPPVGAPPGDRAGTSTPRVPRSGVSTVLLGGATTSGEDPAVPSCPTLGGVWRRAKPRRPGRWTVSVVGEPAAAVDVFAGSKPRADTLLGCVDRDGPGPLVLPVRARTSRALWVRIGTDRPTPESSASLTFREALRGDAESGGGCLASARPQVRGGPARSTRKVRQLNRIRSFELALRVLRGPVCAAHLELRGPGGVTYARGDVAAVRGRGQLVVLRRNRRLRRGLYRLRIEAAGLGGVRRRVPSTVLFRLR
ncbi:MAG TPA: hypothetical protein VF529_02935 [Solirubrobacteraceae bacterium]|jgi:hypothetical protein